MEIEYVHVDCPLGADTCGQVFRRPVYLQTYRNRKDRKNFDARSKNRVREQIEFLEVNCWDQHAFGNDKVCFFLLGRDVTCLQGRLEHLPLVCQEKGVHIHGIG